MYHPKNLIAIFPCGEMAMYKNFDIQKPIDSHIENQSVYVIIY